MAPRRKTAEGRGEIGRAHPDIVRGTALAVAVPLDFKPSVRSRICAPRADVLRLGAIAIFALRRVRSPSDLRREMPQEDAFL
jgi:hypothetical protein